MSTEQNPTTIQLTRKALKKHYALGVLAFIVGIFLWFGSAAWMMTEPTAAANNVRLLGIVLTTVGATWAIVTKVRMWWHHG
jgi:hypothetical protein